MDESGGGLATAYTFIRDTQLTVVNVYELQMAILGTKEERIRECLLPLYVWKRHTYHILVTFKSLSSP